jgi:ubiquinone/menaquinone biosynthesis C-methylase UbiE
MLDIATGTGIVLRLARARHPGLGRLVGLDLTPGMLEVAREKSVGLDIEFVEGDATALPFEDESFDLVTCQQGLQFFPEPQQALREFRRVLAPGGRLIVACWCEIETAPGHHTLCEAVGHHFPDRKSIVRAPFSLTNGETLLTMIQDAGFATAAVERVERSARFASPEEFTRSFMEGSPMALAMADVPPEKRDALARDIAERVRARVGEPVVSPMVTHIVTASP